MSRRLSGLPPEFGVLENVGVKRTARDNDASVFARRTKQRPQPVSEPIPKTPSLPSSMPVERAVIDAEEAIPLSKEQMIHILSREMPMDKASVVEAFMTNNNIQHQQVPSIYSSYFFRKDIIKRFQKDVIQQLPFDKLAGFPLSTYNLYNKDDILNNTMYRRDVLGVRHTEKNTGYTAKSIANMKKFIAYLSKKVCSDIGSTYAKTAVERAIHLINNEAKFDILVASTRVIEDVSLSMDRRLEGVVAFVIVELGECHAYPSAYSINLICTNTKTAIAGTGSVLMGAFLYTILSHPDNTEPTKPIDFPNGDGYLSVTSKRMSNGTVLENCTFGSNDALIPVQQIAVLELASAYANPGGLCMYEKFGFAYDPTMYSDTSKGVECFADRDNLPMLINFATKPGYSGLSQTDQLMKVVNITAGIDKGFSKSKICSVRGTSQTLLGMLKSIQLYVDAPSPTTMVPDDFEPSSPYGLMVSKLKSINPDWTNTLVEVIRYLETPPQQADPNMDRTVDALTSVLPAPKIKGGSWRSAKRKRVSKHRTKKRM